MSLPRFGVTRPVPVNLLMAGLIIAGLYSAATLQREFFPETAPDAAMVTLPYPGATPEEVEQALAIKVEDRLADLDDVARLTTTLAEGGGGIMVEFREGVRDPYRATDEVKRAIDQLTDLPEQAERITVAEFEPRLHVIMVSLYGDAEEDVLKRGIRRVRDDLAMLAGMGEVSIIGAREYEIRVDVAVEAMIEHGLGLPQITEAIRRWMAETPGGVVRDAAGNITVRAVGVEERSDEIGEIILRALPDGSSVRVRDVARVSDSFEDTDIQRRFNGQPVATATVFKVGDQDIIAMASMVKAYVAGRSGRPFQPRGVERYIAGPQQRSWELGANSPHPLPPGTTLAVHSDLARFVDGRLQTLLSAAMWGAMLVFLTLLLFLNWRVAVWVGVGLSTALAGTLVFMQVMDVTLNLLTMFGLIVVLGLLVDDAIVVAENVQARHDRGEASLIAGIRGAEQVSWPVVATVLTSIVAFLPLAFVRGRIGDLLGALPLVVACALAMSLLESLLILPSHMAHSLAHRDRLSQRLGIARRYEQWRDRIILDGVVPAYGRFLHTALRYRYMSLAAALAVLIVSAGMVAGGRLPYVFLTAMDSETIIIDIRLPIGSSIDRTDAVVQRFERVAAAQPETRSISAILGQAADIDTGRTEAAASHIAQMFIELREVEHREAMGGRTSQQIIAAIRDEVGPVPEAERIGFSEITGGPGGPDISVQVRGEAEAHILSTVRDVREALASFAGVVDIADDHSLGQREMQVRLKPGAAALGFTPADVAMQIRGAVFGLDAHVFAAHREDIDVRVRLDERTRRDLRAIENLWLVAGEGRRDGGAEARRGSSSQPALNAVTVPLIEIADLIETAGYSTIRRVDRMRAVTVTADTVPGVSPEAITAALDLDSLRRAHPHVLIETVGRQEQQRDAFASLPIGFLAALIGIYIILAWLFSSYLQPLAVMMAIPFGIIGVIWGHIIMGYELTFLSAIGYVALSGVVVNGSLIYITFYNNRRRELREGRAGMPAATGDEEEGPAATDAPVGRLSEPWEFHRVGDPIHDARETMVRALIDAGRRRLRPIFLTMITTVLGLTPLMLEQSFQARFLIPMAISIAFGLMAATAIILVVLPCMLVIGDDFKRVLHGLWHGRPSGGTAF